MPYGTVDKSVVAVPGLGKSRRKYKQEWLRGQPTQRRLDKGSRFCASMMFTIERTDFDVSLCLWFQVPDHGLLLGQIIDETFYSEVISGPVTRAEQMDTTDSDCASESDDGKVYMPLLPESKLLCQGSSISQKLLPVG